ncbi:hypothetical protein BT96DRAFT_958865 [Gymnopus androsaceus JB14]|uniref:CxC2-like cysteine cluster KDZ transposase-associated domain-containing protein n=1 Tax=Gymnopus androsaceus JB14 TaxID=1447944 RepID=A0A6A4HAE5_9AGAR|nr:hypothetical protein BT96DRAFT_958865 [Gymnopus androsaceus JB14]
MHPKKRRRTNNAYTEELPLGTNDFTFGRSQEVVVKAGLTKTVPIFPQKGSRSWIKVAYWEPEDRSDYALDLPSDEPNEDLWNKSIYPDEGTQTQAQTVQSKAKKKSLQSEWKDGRFIERSLKSLGLPIVLMHQSLSCSNPRACHKQFRVLHTNGIHEVQLVFCGCERGEKVDDHIQLLRRGYYPASQGNGRIKTASTYNFYRGLCKVTDASGLSQHPWRYRALQCGRGHDPSGVAGTADGELVVQCPSCPHPGINLPEGWQNDKKNADLYALRVAMDANFRLKEQLVSSHSRDPGLNDGKGYFVQREPYEKYILSLASEDDISTCIGFQAIIKATMRFSKGLRYTGVGAVGCARGEMWLPNGAGNLQKGETVCALSSVCILSKNYHRYGNMDYIFACILRHYLGILLVIVGYDINQWPCRSCVLPSYTSRLSQSSGKRCLILWMGMTNFELLERLWAIHNVLGNATKTMGLGTCIDVLEAHFGSHNWEKYVGHGATLWQKYKDRLRDRNCQREAHEGLTNSLPEELVQKWEVLFVQWESAPYPKDNVTHPWTTSEEFLSEAEVEKELALEDEQRLRERKRDPLHKTRAAKFMKYSLDIEENHIKTVEELRAIYMPGLLQLLVDKKLPTSHDSDAILEEAKIWFPSLLTTQEREHVCTEGLCDMEIRLRKARLCHTLWNANVRGQRDSGRSQEVIDGIHQRAKGNRSALLALLGPGDWELELQPLHNGDVRSYTDVARKKGPGRQGTNEEDAEKLGEEPMDGILEVEEEEMNLLSEERDRREGTGQSREVISWIWRTTPVSVEDGADNNNELLRVEWGRSRVRMARGLEEVRYVREEMRRMVEFMERKVQFWDDRGGRRIVESEALQEGLKAYALKQAIIQRGLKKTCIDTWKKPLDSKEHGEDTINTDLRMMLGVSAALDEEEEEEDEEEEGGEGQGLDDDEGENFGWV